MKLRNSILFIFLKPHSYSHNIRLEDQQGKMMHWSEHTLPVVPKICVPKVVADLMTCDPSDSMSSFERIQNDAVLLHLSPVHLQKHTFNHIHFWALITTELQIDQMMAWMTATSSGKENNKGLKVYWKMLISHTLTWGRVLLHILLFCDWTRNYLPKKKNLLPFSTSHLHIPFFNNQLPVSISTHIL